MHDDTETLAIIKTTRHRYDLLARRLVPLHPYELPEVIGCRSPPATLPLRLDRGGVDFDATDV